MARELAQKSVQIERHCTAINIQAPPDGPLSLEAVFSDVGFDPDRNVVSMSNAGKCVLNDGELRELPVFANAYSQLRGAVHQKKLAKEQNQA